MKTCYFQADGPTYRQWKAKGYGPQDTLHTLLDYPDHWIRQAPNEVVELPRIRFQAKLTFKQVSDKRIVMQDRFGRPWSVYMGELNVLIPAMTKGSVEAWWTIVKKGSMYGLTVDLEAPLGTVTSDKDVPLLLDATMDLHAIVPEFTAMAV